MEKYTNFGYQKVAESEKSSLVKEVFNSVASKYDLMNDLMSLGVHRIWKKEAVAACNIKPTDKVLDLACGTGDITFKLAKKLNLEPSNNSNDESKGFLIASDINNSMLSLGRDKLTNQGVVGNIRYVQANGEVLPFIDNYFNCITIAFGLRNVTNKSAALTEMYRILKPGGRLVILEFSHPINDGFRKLYDLYSFKILPKIGKAVAQDEASYKYLAESIRMHPKQEELKQMLLDSGFDECEYQNLNGGICAIHKGYKY